MVEFRIESYFLENESNMKILFITREGKIISLLTIHIRILRPYQNIIIIYNEYSFINVRYIVLRINIKIRKCFLNTY